MAKLALAEEEYLPEEVIIEKEDLPEEVIETRRVQRKSLTKLTKEQIQTAIEDQIKRGVKLTFPNEDHWQMSMNFADMPWFFRAEQEARQRGTELENTEWSVGGNMFAPITEVVKSAVYLVNLKRYYTPLKSAVQTGKRV